MDKKNLKKVETFSEYASLHESERTTKKWFWLSPWYEEPYGFVCDFNDFANGNSEWDKLKSYLRNVYPLQYIIREIIPNFISEKWYKIISPFYCRHGYAPIEKWWYRNFSHRNKWAHDSIGYDKYSDKVEMILRFNFASIVDFVEKELAFENIDWESDEQHSIIREKIEEIYNYIKFVKPSYEEYIENRYNNFHNMYDFLIEEKKEEREKINGIRRKMSEDDEKYLKMIMEVRQYLWT
jgi:hypothetical protein